MATIWVGVGHPGKNSLRVGGIYREHHILGEDNANISRLENQRKKEIRWQKILDRWAQASRNKKCIILGDLNLDYAR